MFKAKNQGHTDVLTRERAGLARAAFSCNAFAGAMFSGF